VPATNVVVLRDTRRTHAGACVRRPDVKLVVVEAVAVDCAVKRSRGVHSPFRSQNCEGYVDGFLTQNEGPTQRCGRGRRNTKEMSGINAHQHDERRRAHFCKTISVTLPASCYTLVSLFFQLRDHANKNYLLKIFP